MTTPVEPTPVAFWGACAFCEAPVPFRRIEIAGGPFWGLEAIPKGAGSDHLATWCGDCGPRHREPDDWTDEPVDRDAFTQPLAEPVIGEEARKRIDLEMLGWAIMFGLSPLAFGLPILILSWIEQASR